MQMKIFLNQLFVEELYLLRRKGCKLLRQRDRKVSTFIAGGSFAATTDRLDISLVASRVQTVKLVLKKYFSRICSGEIDPVSIFEVFCRCN